MIHILHTSTVHKTASLADEGDSEYCQSNGAHNIKHIWTYRSSNNCSDNPTFESGIQRLNHSVTAY